MSEDIYVLKWRNSDQFDPMLYFLADPDRPTCLCGCENKEEATKFSSKEEADALPLALPLSDGRGLWDLYELHKVSA